MNVTRLRQVVVAASDRDEVRASLTKHFGLGEPFADPGVGEFGLHNWVFPVGDQFVEVVSPVQADTTAGRFMARHGGDCGYMVIFQVDDISTCRDHLRANECRLIWSYDGDAISASHIHPQDIGAAIVSFDQPQPPSSWQWAGPGWEGRSRSEVVRGVAGMSIGAADPDRLAARWATVLGLPLGADDAGQPCMCIADGSVVRFVGADLAAPRMVGIDLRAVDPDTIGLSAIIGGTTFTAVG